MNTAVADTTSTVALTAYVFKILVIVLSTYKKEYNAIIHFLRLNYDYIFNVTLAFTLLDIPYSSIHLWTFSEHYLFLLTLNMTKNSRNRKTESAKIIITEQTFSRLIL